MGDYWLSLALVGALMLINAIFAGSEMALISLREGQLRHLERRGSRTAGTLVGLARDPNRFLATIQLGITLSGYLASAAAALTLAQPLVPALGFLGTAAPAAAVAVVTVALAFVTLVIGELAPKRLAMQHALRWAMLIARPIDLLASIPGPRSGCWAGPPTSSCGCSVVTRASVSSHRLPRSYGTSSPVTAG